MKSRGLIVALFLMYTLLFWAACSKQEESRQGNVMVNILPQGKWIITKFSEKGHDETNHFNGYIFKFNQNGRLMVSIPGSIAPTDIEGSWVELESNKFVINLGQKDQTNKPLGGLSDDWIIVAKSAKRFSLKDDTGTRNEVVEFSMN